MEEGDETTSKERMHASADKKLLTNLGPIISTDYQELSRIGNDNIYQRITSCKYFCRV